MPSFTYKVRDRSGKAIAGTLEAPSLEMAGERLYRLGYFPITIQGENKGGHSDLADLWQRFQKVTQEDLIFFSKQLSTLYKAGMPLLTGMKSLIEQTNKKKLKSILEDISRQVEGGKTLSEAMSRHPAVFPPVYMNMVRAGETTGLLGDSLDRFITLSTREMRIRQRVKEATRYPKIILVSLVIASFVLVALVIPRFVHIFAQFNTPLPWPTRVLIGVHKFFQAYGYFFFLGLGGILLLLKKYSSTPSGKIEIAGAKAGFSRRSEVDPGWRLPRTLAEHYDRPLAPDAVATDTRYDRGLQYQFAYTWSRARDLASDVGFGSGDIYLSMLWDADLVLDRDDDNSARKADLYGPTRFDMRHVLSFNASYELPWKDTGGLLGALVNDWQVSGTAYYRDGYPVNVFCAANASDCNIDGVAQDRPNVLDPGVVGYWFNDKPTTTADTQIQHILPTAFSQVIAPGAAGDLGRNLFRIDDFLSVDFALIRNIGIVRRQRAQFRFDVYNLFNNSYAGAPSLGLGTPADFGKISSVAGYRSIQIAFKYLW